MTSQMIAKDAAYLVSAQPISRTQQPTAADPIVARMDQIELSGTYDKDAGGLRRSRQGAVGTAQMTCQVAASGTDTLLLFWSLADNHQRRVLVNGMGTVYMETNSSTGRGAIKIGERNKYFDAVSKILRARAN